MLVLVGLHCSHGEDFSAEVLANCRAALMHGRAMKLPVAFVRNVRAPKSIHEPRSYPAWLRGFEARRTDMVFDTLQPSCYSCAEFCEVMEHSPGNFVIAGLFGETNCLSTAVDAYHRKHKIIFLEDASASRPRGNVPASAMHSAVAKIMSVYATVMKTAAWINRATEGIAIT